MWASRPGLNAELLGNNIFFWWRWQPGTPAVLERGFRVMLACSSAGEVVLPYRFIERLGDWLVSHGLRAMPVRTTRHAEASADALMAELLRREQLDGIASLQLVPALIMAIDISAATPAATTALGERAMAIMEKAAAPADLILGMAPAPNDTADLNAWLARRTAILAADHTSDNALVRLEMRYRLAGVINQRNPAAAVDLLNDITAAPLTVLPAQHRLRRAVADALAEFDDVRGKRLDADRRRIAAGLPRDLCSQADADPQLTGVEITEDDYPEAARLNLLTGTVLVEHRIDERGRVARSRVVYAQPPRLFDDATLKPFKGAVTTVLPRRGGKPFACERGPQRIRWQLNNWNRE